VRLTSRPPFLTLSFVQEKASRKGSVCEFEVFCLVSTHRVAWLDSPLIPNPLLPHHHAELNMIFTFVVKQVNHIVSYQSNHLGSSYYGHYNNDDMLDDEFIKVVDDVIFKSKPMKAWLRTQGCWRAG
jgi:hypothetical protein